ARHQLPCISDKEVELVRFQQPEQVPPMSNFDTSPNSRMIARDARKNRLNQYRSGDRSQPDCDLSELVGTHASDVALQACYFDQHPLAATDDKLAICGRRDLALTAIEQLDA